MKQSTQRKKDLYEAPLVVVVFLLIVYYLTGQGVLLKCALGIGLLSLVSKSVSIWIGVIWEKILRFLGFVNAHILLTAVFVVVLLPVSALYRLFNKDALNLKPGKDSYFVERNHTFTSEDLENPW